MTDLYERWLPKGREVARSEIAKDRDRIIHSGAFRRLQGKSQVFGAQMTDYFRNRLTHSLECAQIGGSIASRSPNSEWRSCAETLADFQTLVEAACLVHDIGHPPFGHNGEQELSRLMQRYATKRFEGNAQSFRIVTFIEPKEIGEVSPDNERWVGLNLTRTTLRAVCKYPWLETDSIAEHHGWKFSAYDEQEDRDYFDWVWQGEKELRKTLAAEIMDVADDIAYATHDFEDGVWSGMIPLHDLVLVDEAAVLDLHRKVSEKNPALKTNDVAVALTKLWTEAFRAGKFKDDELAWIRRPFERTRLNLAYLKRLSAGMVGMLIEAVTPAGDFRKPLGEIKLFIQVLTGIAWVWMIERSDLATRRLGQRRIIRELFQGYARDLSTLPRQKELQEIRDEASNARDEHLRTMRLVCDHIAGMTDQYALRAHEEMYQGKSPFEIRYLY